MKSKIWKMNFRRLTDKYVAKIDKMVELSKEIMTV